MDNNKTSGNIIKRLFSSDNRKQDMTHTTNSTDATKAYDPALGIPFFNVSASSFNRVTLPEDVKAIAQTINIAVYRSVQVISGEIGGMEWEIVDSETGEVVDSTKATKHSHPLGAAISEQYKRSGQPFFTLWTASLLISGKTFIQPLHSVLDDTIKKPVSMRTHVGVNWLNPINVQIEQPLGVIIGYTYNTEHGTITFAKDEIVYDRLLNLSDDNEGLSPTQLAIDNVTIDEKSKQALKNYYINDATPYSIITATDGTTHAIRSNVDWWKSLQDKLLNKFKGAANKYKSLVVGEPLQVNTFDAPDLQKHTVYLQDIRNEIYVAFGVPPAVAGDTTGTPYKDAPETYEAFFTQGIEPYVRRIEQAINEVLMIYFDKSHRYQFRFNTSKYDALRKNESEEIANAKELYQSGAITLQSYQQLVATEQQADKQTQAIWDNIPPMIFVPALNMPVPLEQLPNLWKTQIPQAENIAPPTTNSGNQAAIELVEDDETKTEDEIITFDTVNGYRLKEHTQDELMEIGAQKATSELKQWLKHKRNKSKSTFVFKEIRQSVEEFINSEIIKGTKWMDIFTMACKMHSIKAIATTEANYKRAVAAMIAEARAGNLTKKRFRDNYRNLAKNTITRAYSDGLEDAGVFAPLSDEDKEAIRKLKLEPTPFVKQFADKLFSDEGVTDAQAATKPQAWWASITPSYSAGLESGGDNGMYEWAGTDGVNTCKDCARLDILPDRHRKKAWKRRGLDLTGGAFIEQNTECKGFQCKHYLERTTGRAQGKF